MCNHLVKLRTILERIFKVEMVSICILPLVCFNGGGLQRGQRRPFSGNLLAMLNCEGKKTLNEEKCAI